MKAANDNSFVQMYGGANTDPTLAMLERLHDEISTIDPNAPRKVHPGAFGVYIIGSVDPDYVKIGKASSVLARLRSLQTGNPLKLYVHRIFGFGSTSDTTKVESWAHQDAGRLYGRAVGEWFRCGTVDAHNLIAEICEKERIRCWVRTPLIEAQWVLDEPAGLRHEAERAERQRLYWEERERKDELKYGKASAA